MEILVVLFLLIVIALAVWQACARAKRRQALKEWAESNGLRFSPQKDWTVEQRFPEFKRLQEGSNRYAYNIMQGGWSGRAFLGFDCHYETRTMDSKGRRQTQHHYFSAVILESDLPLKPLFIRPEGFFDKVTEFFGFDDIDFESAEFSRKFYVKAEDRRWAYDVIHTRIEVVPSNVVAALFGFREEEYFEIENASERTAPKADLRGDL